VARPAVATGATKLQRGGLSLLSGERRPYPPLRRAVAFPSSLASGGVFFHDFRQRSSSPLVSFIRSDRETRAGTWSESTVGTGARKLALPLSVTLCPVLLISYLAKHAKKENYKMASSSSIPNALAVRQNSPALLLPALARWSHCSLPSVPLPVLCRCFLLLLPNGWRDTTAELRCSSGMRSRTT
jgi:hypothetical protein